jgi:hypothetical protein
VKTQETPWWSQANLDSNAGEISFQEGGIRRDWTFSAPEVKAFHLLIVHDLLAGTLEALFPQF